MRNYFALISLGTCLVSWFTKVHSAQKGPWFSLVYGWEAFRIGMAPLWPGRGSATSWSNGSPFAKGYAVLTEIIPSFLSVPSSLTNGWMLLLGVAIAIRKTTAWRSILFSGFVFCFCLNLFWVFSPLGWGQYEGKAAQGELRPGYYLWVLSFAFAAVALGPRPGFSFRFFRRIFGRMVLPALIGSVLFWGYFSIQDIRSLQNRPEKKGKETNGTPPPSFRTLDSPELTCIPVESKKISTPFLSELNNRILADAADANPLVERAYVHAIWGNEEQSREDFKKALTLTRDKSSVYWSMGWALLNLEHFQEAEEAWSKAWNPRDGGLEPAWVPGAMAMVCWKIGDKNRALAWYQRAVERDPKSFLGLEGLKEHTINWTSREQGWLIEVYEVWKRTYLDRNSERVMRKRLSQENSGSACSANH